MQIRSYSSSDCSQTIALFNRTVHTINAKDYTPEQLDAWAPEERDAKAWNQSFENHTALVAVIGGKLAGFGDLDCQSGLLDRLYVSADFQNQGVGSALCDALEKAAGNRLLITHASITAKPFFEKRGWRVLQKQQVIRHGIALTNYVMEKKNAAP